MIPTPFFEKAFLTPSHVLVHMGVVGNVDGFPLLGSDGDPSAERRVFSEKYIPFYS